MPKEMTCKRTTTDGLLTIQEEVMIEGSPASKRPTPITSGRALMDVSGEATSIGKKHLPHNTLFQVMELKTVDIRRTDQAVYMTSKVLFQAQRNDRE